MNAELQCIELVPGVGICQHDLVFFAERVLNVLTGGTPGSMTASAIREGALLQTAFNLGTLCDQMQDSKEEAGDFENILRQQQYILELAGECAETLATLAALPSMAHPNGRNPKAEAAE